MTAINLARYYATDDVLLAPFVQEDYWLDRNGNFVARFDTKRLTKDNGVKYYNVNIEFPFKECVECVNIYDLFGCAKCQLYKGVN